MQSAKFVQLMYNRPYLYLCSLLNWIVSVQSAKLEVVVNSLSYMKLCTLCKIELFSAEFAEFDSLVLSHKMCDGVTSNTVTFVPSFMKISQFKSHITHQQHELWWWKILFYQGTLLIRTALGQTHMELGISMFWMKQHEKRLHRSELG
jgi:hypothetical protein